MNYTRYTQYTARVSLLIALFLMLFGSGLLHTVRAQETVVVPPLGNWAWGASKTHTDPLGVDPDPTEAGGVGWIDMSSLHLDSHNKIIGDAWSDNFGWLQFSGIQDSEVPSTNPVYCGVSSSGCAPHYEVENGVDTVFGWARFASRGQTPGWNGWVALHGPSANNAVYKITRVVTNAPDPDVEGGTIVKTDVHGYAWGGPVVGWIQFGFPNLTAVPPLPPEIPTRCSVTKPDPTNSTQTIPVPEYATVVPKEALTFSAFDDNQTPQIVTVWKDRFHPNSAPIGGGYIDTTLRAESGLSTLDYTFTDADLGEHRIQYSTSTNPADISTDTYCIDLYVAKPQEKYSPYEAGFYATHPNKTSPLRGQINISKKENVDLYWSIPVVDPLKNERVKSCTLQASPNDQGQDAITTDGNKEISGLSTTHTFTFSCVVEKTDGADPATVLETFDSNNTPALSKTIRVQFIGEGKIKEF